jgi:hypothetical protein
LSRWTFPPPSVVVVLPPSPSDFFGVAQLAARIDASLSGPHPDSPMVGVGVPAPTAITDRFSLPSLAVSLIPVSAAFGVGQLANAVIFRRLSEFPASL